MLRRQIMLGDGFGLTLVVCVSWSIAVTYAGWSAARV